MPSADDDELESEKNQQPVQKSNERTRRKKKKKGKYEAKQEDRFSRLAFVCVLSVLTSRNSSNKRKKNEMT